MYPFHSAVRKLASFVFYLAPVVLFTGSLAAKPGTLSMGCTGGSVVYDSTTPAPHTAVGCLFPNWGPSEQAQCANLVVFNPANAGTCHLCVQSQYTTMVNNGSYLLPNNPMDPFSDTRLTLDQYPIAYFNGVHTPFRCLKCSNAPVGMVAWWGLDDYTASQPVRDTRMLMSDGTRHGTTAIPGKVGNASWFNGVNDFIEVPSNHFVDVASGPTSPIEGDFSIDAWVKIEPQESNAGVRVILEKRTANFPNLGHYTGYSFYLYNGNLGLQLADTTSTYANYISTLSVPRDGQWHFVAVTVERAMSPNTLRFFLDGAVTIRSGPVPQGTLQNPSPVRIGMVTTNNNNEGAFNGAIDEVEFFRFAIAPADFAAIFNADRYGKCIP